MAYKTIVAYLEQKCTFKLGFGFWFLIYFSLEYTFFRHTQREGKVFVTIKAEYLKNSTVDLHPLLTIDGKCHMFEKQNYSKMKHFRFLPPCFNMSVF